MAGSSKYQSINPATGQVACSFPENTDAEVAAAIDSAQDCYEKDWRWRTFAARSQIINRVASIIRGRAQEMAELVTKEMGKLFSESLAEVDLSIRILEYYAKNAEAFLKPVSLEEPGSDATSELVSEPIGIIAAIEPWNFPYYQLARVAGPQLMAGNVVMVKHAASVPQCALAFAKAFEDAGAPRGLYSNLFTSRSQMDDLIGDFRVRGVTLTGSEVAGAAVAELAGRHLKKAILELGGSDPFIVLEDADIDFAVSQATIGRMSCMGQVCAAPKRFIVVGKERSQHFMESIRRSFAQLKAGDPMDSSTSIGPLSSEATLRTLLEQIDRATSRGATVAYGGKRLDRPGFFLEPTILTDVLPENPIFHEELFGPVAMMFSVETEDAAVELANATKFGLGSSVHSNDPEHARAVGDRIDAGMVFVNSCAVLTPELPFGGIKNSGFGRELSKLGIDEFINKKLVRVASLRK